MRSAIVHCSKVARRMIAKFFDNKKCSSIREALVGVQFIEMELLSLFTSRMRMASTSNNKSKVLTSGS